MLKRGMNERRRPGRRQPQSKKWEINIFKKEIMTKLWSITLRSVKGKKVQEKGCGVFRIKTTSKGLA